MPSFARHSRTNRLAFACAASLALGTSAGFIAPAALSGTVSPFNLLGSSSADSYALMPISGKATSISAASATAEAIEEGRQFKLKNRQAQVRAGYFSDAALEAAKEAAAKAAEEAAQREAEEEATAAGSATASSSAAAPSSSAPSPVSAASTNLGAVLAGGITQNFISSLGTVYVPREGQSIPAGMDIVGVRGTFITASSGQNLDTAIAHINEIRLDAYNSGLVSRYVPIQRSPALERTSQIRAVEATVYPGHTRPNGSYPSSLSAEGFATGGYENIAWGGRTLHAAIDQWAEEKSEYVKELAGQSHGITGHYTTLINPDLTYVGLGMFQHSSTYGTTIVGTFSSSNPTGPSQSLSGAAIQGVYVPASAVPAGSKEFSLSSSSIGSSAVFGATNNVIGLRALLQAESGN